MESVFEWADAGMTLPTIHDLAYGPMKPEPPPISPERAARLKAERKLGRRKLNEHIKMFASAFNSLGLTSFAAVTITPLVTGNIVTNTPIWIIVGLGLHGWSHVLLRLMVSEE